jgi:hypothetical protein
MKKTFATLALLLSSLHSYGLSQETGEIDADLDYVLWWTNGTYVPPLVTTSPSGTAQNQAGILPNASILFGDDSYNDTLRHGGRVTMTRWLDTCKSNGLELSYFGAGSPKDLDFHESSTGSPILARPFRNTSIPPAFEDSQLVAFPDLVAGSINIHGNSEFHSGSVLARINSCKSKERRIDWLAGYRFFKYREGLQVSEEIISTNPLGLLAQGTTINVLDDFSTSSAFHGGELGIGWTGCLNEWLSLQSTSKLAIGGLYKRLSVRGNTQVSVPGGGATSNQGGLLALSSNIGDRNESDFAFLPEVGIKARALLTSHLEFNVGYTALYLTNVARVGDAIDRNVNTDLLPPAIATSNLSPISNLSDSGLFVHGLSLGATLIR